MLQSQFPTTSLRCSTRNNISVPGCIDLAMTKVSSPLSCFLASAIYLQQENKTGPQELLFGTSQLCSASVQPGSNGPTLAASFISSRALPEPSPRGQRVASPGPQALCLHCEHFAKAVWEKADPRLRAGSGLPWEKSECMEQQALLGLQSANPEAWFCVQAVLLQKEEREKGEALLKFFPEPSLPRIRLPTCTERWPESSAREVELDGDFWTVSRLSLQNYNPSLPGMSQTISLSAQQVKTS